MTTRWRREHVAEMTLREVDRLPLIHDDDVVAVAAGIDIWDSWPIRTPDGSVADIAGGSVWVALAAPAEGDPGLRHDIAHQRAFFRAGGAWEDLGLLFPNADALGTRQWAGSTQLDGDRITAYYTAAGVPTLHPPGYRQRLVVTTATLDRSGARPAFVDWSEHREIVPPDLTRFDSADDPDGEPGFIKAYRDPSPFVDPVSGDEFLLFTASMAPSLSSTDFNGAIGIARRTGDGADDWQVLDPVITADGVNNELERPHVVAIDGRYYVFFSTQSRTFHPEVVAPTGLYGFVADDLLGPYEPLNDSALVFTNPLRQPFQAYSWLVLNDLSVVGFVDAYGVQGEPGQHVVTELHDVRRRAFGGTFSPTVHITLDGAQASLVGA